jgi:hypothetical protein
LNSIYHPVDPSKFSTPPFLEPGSYDASNLRLFVTADCQDLEGRWVDYALKTIAGKELQGAAYTVTEHFRPEEKMKDVSDPKV